MEEFISDEFIGSILDEIEKSLSEVGASAEGGRFLSFVCDHQRYGIPILKVKAVAKRAPAGTLPRMNGGSMGFIRIREEFVPVFDLRELFGIPKVPYTDRAPMVLVEVWQDMKLRRYALIVDEIEDILTINDKDIQPVPEYIRNMKVSYLTGIFLRGDRIVLLLDVFTLIEKFRVEGGAS